VVAYHVQMAAGAFQPCGQIRAGIDCVCVDVVGGALGIDVIWSGLVKNTRFFA
jgi:hypothetical protein